MKLGIVGSRKFSDRELFIDVITTLDGWNDWGGYNYITGDCPTGADKMIYDHYHNPPTSLRLPPSYAENLTVHKADWECKHCDGSGRILVKTSLVSGKTIDCSQCNGKGYDKSAGPIRNQKIVDDADELVAFLVDGEECKGTWSSIRLALKKGIPVHIYTEL